MIVVAAFEAPAVVAGLDDVAVVGQAVEKRGRHLGIPEHAGPFTEGEIGGEDDGGALVEPADEMEQQLADWVGHAAWHLRPLQERLLVRLKQRPRLFADETTAPVLDPGRG